MLVTVAQKGRNHILEGVEESCSYSDEGQCAIYLDGTPVSSDQSLSHIQLFAVSWTAACQASLFITNSRSLLKLMSIKSVMPFNHLILCHPLLLPPTLFPRVFSNELVLRIRWPKYILPWSVLHMDFPGGSNNKVSACNVRDLGLISGSGRSSGELATHSSILP